MAQQKICLFTYNAIKSTVKISKLLVKYDYNNYIIINSSNFICVYALIWLNNYIFINSKISYVDNGFCQKSYKFMF